MNSPTITRHLINADTGDDYGTATPEQVAASDAAVASDGGYGLILLAIDDIRPDGTWTTSRIIAPGSWDAENSPTVTAYVQ